MVDPRLETVVEAIARHYGDRLLGVVLFGSRAGSRAREDSDWDVLVVLSDTERVRRGLYDEWETLVAPAIETVLPHLSPHFVRLPSERDAPSGLWLEVALAHTILSDPTSRVGAWLGRVRRLIDAGRFERRAVHGIPYWRSAV